MESRSEWVSSGVTVATLGFAALSTNLQERWRRRSFRLDCVRKDNEIDNHAFVGWVDPGTRSGRSPTITRKGRYIGDVRNEPRAHVGLRCAQHQPTGAPTPQEFPTGLRRGGRRDCGNHAFVGWVDPGTCSGRSPTITGRGATSATCGMNRRLRWASLRSAPTYRSAVAAGVSEWFASGRTTRSR